jgi:xanthine dehydrogenase YagR molybdenum-binding subunit
MGALDAVVHVQGPSGAREIPIGELHRLPGDTPERDHMLAHGELITAVDVRPVSGRSTYRKVRDRASYAFAAGRIVNPRTARSQFAGGMTMGLSTALWEQSTLDPVTGHYINHDPAEYHIATCADIRDLQVGWIEEDDPHVNPMGTKGIGEIGIVGTAAAVANAVHNATGIRVRHLPITPDKLLNAGL